MIVVYTSISPPDPDHGGRRCLRMALQPLDCELMGKGPKFPFRVAWRWEGDPADHGWMVSCRGKQEEIILGSYVGVHAMYTDDLDEVLSFLLRGEPEEVQQEVLTEGVPCTF